MRIDRFLSDMGVASRKEAKDVARRGGVFINGKPVKDTSVHIDPKFDTVTYLGRVITYREHTYVMLNKPEGYVSATEDASLPYVTELLPDELRRLDLFPVGRLDKDTTGLMILTDHGELAHSVLSPRHHVEKVYRFSSAEPMRDGVEEEFKDGVTLKDGYECKSAKILLDSDRMGGLITLTEGKYHQIKRMVASTSNRVTSLERISFGGISLDRTLARGEWRFLSEDEISLLKNWANI